MLTILIYDDEREKKRKREVEGKGKEGVREREGGEEGLFTITGNNNLTIKKDSFPA